MADLTISVDIDARGAKTGAGEVKTAIGGIRQSIAGIDLSALSAKLRSAGAMMQQFGGQLRQAGMAATLAFTLPLAAAGQAILSAGAEYEKALNIFQAVTKATTEEMERASQVAKDLGADLTLPATSAKDAALAMNELGKAGLSATESMDAAKGVLQLAAAGQLEEARAAEIAANALNSFNLKASETTRIADLLAAAANSSSVEIIDVADSMQMSSAVFAAAKVPIEDLVTAIGLLGNAGIKGSDAGTSLKQFLLSLQAPAASAAQLMKQLGIEVYDTSGRMKSMPDLIDTFNSSLQGMTDQARAAILTKIFGSDAIRAANILFSTSTDGFNKLKSQVTETGAAADLANAKMQGLSGRWEAFKSQLETIGIDIFDVVKAPLTRFLEQASVWAGKLGEAFRGLSPNVQLVIIAFVALAAALGPVLVVIGAVVGAIGTLVSAIGALIGSATAVGIAIAAMIGFLIQIGPVLVLAAVEIYLLYQAWQKNFGGIRDLTKTVADFVVATWNTAVTEIRELTASVMAEVTRFWAENGEQIMAIVGEISEFIRATWTAIVDFWRENGETITAISSAVWDAVKTVIVKTVRIIGDVITIFLKLAKGDWAAAWNAMKDIVASVLQVIGSIVRAGTSVLIGIVKLMFQAIWDLHAWVLQKAVELGQAIGTGLANGVRAMRDRVVEAARNLVDQIPIAIRLMMGISSPSKVTETIGGQIGEGLAIGIEGKLTRVKTVAKRMADETVKQLKEAVAEFEKLAGASPDQVARIQQANAARDAANQQQEIIGLRGELGLYRDVPLPETIAGTEDQLKRLQAMKKEADEWAKFLEAMPQLITENEKAIADFMQSIRDAGAMNVIAMQEEIALIGVTDTMERERIKNYYDLQRLRQEMQLDGFGPQQIEEAVAITKATQAQRLELEKIADIRRQVAGAEELGEDLTGRLELLRNGNRELSEYEKTLRLIAKDYKDISVGQKEYLLGLAQQIDDQKAYNELYDQLHDAISRTFDILTSKGKSWGEKMKDIFGGIFNNFKKMLSDMAASWLTGNILGGGQAGGGGGLFGGIFNGIFGGGRSGASGGAGGVLGGGLGGIFNAFPTGNGPGGTPYFNPNAGGSGVNTVRGGLFGNLFGGGFGGLLGGLAGILPMAGLGLGASLGGGGLAGILGGAGGLLAGAVGFGIASPAGLAGLIGMAGFSPGAALSIAGVLGPIALIAAPLLLAGAYFLKRNKLRRQEETIRNRGILDAFEQLKGLDTIIAEVKGLRLDPASGLAQATQLAAQVRQQYLEMANSLKDKKTRNHALKDVSRIDLIVNQKMAELRAAADVAFAAGDRDRRMIPEFASGVYMSPQFMAFRRMNGMLGGGAWTGRDVIPALLAHRELVLNPVQQQTIIHNAGFDVFKTANIPGYAGGVAVSSQQLAVSSQPIAIDNSPIVVELSVQQDAAGMFRVAAQSPSGRKVLLDVVGDGFANEEINQKRRGA